MKWSRRQANFRNLPLVADVFERWKHPGNSLINVIFEIYTERFSPAPGWYLRISLQSLRREARFHRLKDMVNILRWVGCWPNDRQHIASAASEPCLEVCTEVCPEVCTEGGLNHGRSMPEACPKLARSMLEPALNPDRIVIELTKTHVLILIPNFLELCDYYTKQRAADLAHVSKVASKSSAPSLTSITINSERDGPGAVLVDLINLLAGLSSKNGKRFNGLTFTGEAVRACYHPKAIIETMIKLAKRWPKVATPESWARSTLSDKGNKHGWYDWDKHPEEKAVWLAIAEGQGLPIKEAQ